MQISEWASQFGPRDGSKASLRGGGSKQSSKAGSARDGSKQSASRLSPLPGGGSKGPSYLEMRSVVPPRPDSPGDLGSPSGTSAKRKLPAISSTDIRNAKVHQLSRRHRLDPLEVRDILVRFDKAYETGHGVLAFVGFRQTLCGIFDRKELDEKVVKSAWEATTSGSAGDLDGMIDMEAFLSWYVANMFSQVCGVSMCAGKAASEALINELARKHSVTPHAMDKVKRRFDEFDTDGSGQMEYDEFVEMMKKFFKDHGDNLSPERLKKFWQEIDLDGSGEVDFGEFTHWYLKYFDPDDEGQGGPIEALYNSFNPDVQRKNHLALQTGG